MNKVIIGILVLLLIVTGVLGYYSFDLNKQIDTLSDELNNKLTTNREETANQISTLSDVLTTHREKIATQVNTLSDGLTTHREKIATQINTLSDELEGVSTEISQSVINGSKLYEKVKSGVVEVYAGKEVSGSGFVFDAEEGYIVTNYHVVKEALDVDVVLYDGTTYRVSTASGCEYSDIAVLKLGRDVSVEPLELADSNAVVIGEPVIVIGSPFNLPGTVTSGIISQKGGFETFAEEEPYYMVANLIQYSAASNFGNSGGPLLNCTGEVIGLVTGRIDPELGDGICYAISSNKVNRVVRSLIDNGSFDNPTLPGDWTLENITTEEAQAKGLETTNGILVTEANSAAVFEADDIIIAIDGVAVRSAADLFNYLGEHKSPGDTVTLTVIGEKGKMEVFIKLVKGGVLFRDEGFQRHRA